MKRWFYILLGGFGIMLTLWSLFTMIYSPQLPPTYAQWLLPSQIVLALLGLILGWAGFLNGKRAGEFDIGQYVRSSRKRDHRVNGTEIDLACPACHKTYRASPLLAGKPFRCRECNDTFIVQTQTSPLAVKTGVPAA